MLEKVLILIMLFLINGVGIADYVCQLPLAEPFVSNYQIWLQN